MLSAKGTDPIFEQQSNGPDLVLTSVQRFGMGYGLSTPDMDIGPRACQWGGYGGSRIVMDQETELTVAYMMNRMESALVVDRRGDTIMREAMRVVEA